MKTYFVALAVALTGLMLTSSAVAGSASSPDESLYVVPDLSLLSVGVGWEKMDRELDSAGRATSGVAQSLYGYLGLDVLSWATVRAGIGETECKDDYGDYGEGDAMWMVGVDCSLWQHEVTSPPYAAHKLELLVSYDYYDHATDCADWTENRLSAVIAATFKARHAMPDANNVPYGIMFCAGPVMSVIDGEDGTKDYDEADDVGLLLGADLKFHRNLSLGWEGRVFGDAYSHTVVGALHF